jgi:fructose/tagatose bisphosphate aldolase
LGRGAGDWLGSGVGLFLITTEQFKKYVLNMEEEIEVEIGDVEDTEDGLAYKVKCNSEIAYLRRKIFELISKKKDIINLDMGYLKELFEKLNIK